MNFFIIAGGIWKTPEHLKIPVNPNEEKNILAELRKRNREVFVFLFNTYYRDLLLFAEQHVFSRDTANDMVQETFVRLWEKAPEVNITTSIKAYLFASVRNRCLDYLKHLQVQDKHRQQLAEAQLYTQNLDISIDGDTDQKLKEAINALPDQRQKIIRLNCLEGKKYQEIANQLGISVNTVKTQVARAYRQLRSKISTLESVLLFFW